MPGSCIDSVRHLVLNYNFAIDWASLTFYDGCYFNGVKSIFFEQLDPTILSESLHYYIDIDVALSTEAAIPIGASKRRGLPHLPKAWNWPEGYYFLAQLNIAQFKAYDIDHLFPSQGMIYFFENGSDIETLFYEGPLEALEVRPYPSTMRFPYQTYYVEEYKNKTYRFTFSPKCIFYITDIDNYAGGIYKIIPDNLRQQLESLLHCKLEESGHSGYTHLLGKPAYFQSEEIKLKPKKELLLFHDEYKEGCIHIWIPKFRLEKKEFKEAFMKYSGS